MLCDNKEAWLFRWDCKVFFCLAVWDVENCKKNCSSTFFCCPDRIDTTVYCLKHWACRQLLMTSWKSSRFFLSRGPQQRTNLGLLDLVDELSWSFVKSVPELGDGSFFPLYKKGKEVSFSKEGRHSSFSFMIPGTQLGGGFKQFLCSSLFEEMIQFDEYFLNGLVQPPTSQDVHSTQLVFWKFRKARIFTTSNFLQKLRFGRFLGKKSGPTYLQRVALNLNRLLRYGRC